MLSKLYHLVAVSCLMFFLAGCGNKGVSGAYIATGPQLINLLQLTESKDGQLLGSMSEVKYKADGTMERMALSVSGTTDGQSITIAVKSDTLLAQSVNLSGTVEDGGITFSGADGTERFSKSTVDDYQAKLSELNRQAASLRIEAAREQHSKEVAAAHQAQQEALNARLLNESKQVDALTAKLNDYATLVEAKHDLSPFHVGHTKLLAAARHDLELQKALPKGSYAASQADFRINQLAFQLNQVDFPYSNFLDQARGHLQDFDRAIANSPCHVTSDALANCSNEHNAEAAYAKAKAIVESELGGYICNDRSRRRGDESDHPRSRPLLQLSVGAH